MNNQLKLSAASAATTILFYFTSKSGQGLKELKLFAIPAYL